MAQKEEAIPKPDEQFDPWDPQGKEGSNSCRLSSELCAYANTHKVKLNTEKSKRYVYTYMQADKYTLQLLLAYCM